jgi:hypothetical protein
VTLTAAPAANSSFVGWAGGACRGMGACQLSMFASQSVTATFATITPTLTTPSAALTPPSSPSPIAEPLNLRPPTISGTALPGRKLLCSNGLWSGAPSTYTYQWRQSGRIIPGADSPWYTVQIGDEAQTLSCVVNAANHWGLASSASTEHLVAVPGTLNCPRPTGRLKGARLGPVEIGVSGRRLKSLRRSSLIADNFGEFCLYAGFGIRAGYASPSMLETLPRPERERLQNRVVLALTSNPYYTLDGVRPGMSWATAAKKLGTKAHGRKTMLNATAWYLTKGLSAFGVLKVRMGEVLEVGVADKALLSTRAAEQRFLRSFRPAPP